VPSLFTFNVPDSYLLDLAGVSVPQATVSIREADLRETGPLLITHWGFSGPAVLKLSAWGARHLHGTNYQFTVEINWLPEYSPEKLRENLVAYRDGNAKKIVAANPLFGLPIRLWKKVTAQAGIGEQLRWAELSKKSLNQLITLLVAAPFRVRGKSTFKEEFVTCGGVSLDDIHLPSLESRHCRNLFFAGEVLNIDGITGGFNFQSAWTTGFIAGKNMG
jgi:predicted Rossmann fold flavoprotein